MNDKTNLRPNLTRALPRVALALCAACLAVAFAASDLTATFTGDRVDVQQVFAGEGYRSIGLANESAGPITFTLARLRNATVAEYEQTNDALLAAIATKADEGPSITTLMTQAEALGGTSVAAHETAQMFADLEEGTYVVAAAPQTDAQDSRPWYAAFMVTESGEPVAAPQPANVLDLADFSFDIPATLDPGTRLWEITNVGEQPHLAAFFKLLPGKTAADAEAFFAAEDGAGGPPPFDPTETVEVGALTPGATVYMPLDFSSGQWVAVCFVQDLHDAHVMHFMEGMIEQFTVS